MKILNTSFSKSGKEWFEGLKKDEQVAYLKARNPMALTETIKLLLKDVKFQKNTRKAKTSYKRKSKGSGSKDS
jgi:hypothetical protein